MARPRKNYFVWVWRGGRPGRPPTKYSKEEIAKYKRGFAVSTTLSALCVTAIGASVWIHCTRRAGLHEGLGLRKLLLMFLSSRFWGLSL